MCTRADLGLEDKYIPSETCTTKGPRQRDGYNCGLFALQVITSLVHWGTEVSDSFNVSNGVKQCVILSPILFAMYIDGLLIIKLLSTLEKQGIGCHIGSKFVGALAYADDITLISPTVDGMRRMIKTCEDYAIEYNIMFNGQNSLNF